MSHAANVFQCPSSLRLPYQDHMGAILPKPILSKSVDRVGNNRIAAASCCINGYRNTMEDAHCMNISDDRMLFGVFDGHSSDKCSAFIAEKLPPIIMGEALPISDARLTDICVELDREFINSGVHGGTTGTFCILEHTASPPRLTICNVGDSRILVVRDGKVLFATQDHKPQNPEERARIEKCGGMVRMNRVDGDLAVSRAFGDATFKRHLDGTDLRNQRVIAVPEISRLTLNANDMIVLACDGVFEGAFTNEEVAAMVWNTPAPKGDYGVIAANVCDTAVKRGSKDNISCMIARLADGTGLVPTHGESSFVPGPPYPRHHEQCKTAYARMAEVANTTLVDALRRRYELFQAYTNGSLGSMAPISQLAFEMSDEVDVNTEAAFWGTGPGEEGDMDFFITLANSGGR